MIRPLLGSFNINKKHPVCNNAFLKTIENSCSFIFDSTPLKLWGIIFTKVLLHMSRIGNKSSQFLWTQNLSTTIKSSDIICHSNNTWFQYFKSIWYGLHRLGLKSIEVKLEMDLSWSCTRWSTTDSKCSLFHFWNPFSAGEVQFQQLFV